MLNQQLAAATGKRDDANAAALDAIKLVVNSVWATRLAGEGGELYRAMG